MPDATPTATVPASRVEVPTTAHRRRAWFLLAFAAWNVWLWATRLVNLVRDDAEHSTAFLVVHAVLFVVSLSGSAILGLMGVRMRREART